MGEADSAAIAVPLDAEEVATGAIEPAYTERGMRSGFGRFPRLRVGLVSQAYDQGR